MSICPATTLFLKLILKLIHSTSIQLQGIGLFVGFLGIFLTISDILGASIDFIFVEALAILCNCGMGEEKIGQPFESTQRGANCNRGLSGWSLLRLDDLHPIQRILHTSQGRAPRDYRIVCSRYPSGLRSVFLFFFFLSILFFSS